MELAAEEEQAAVTLRPDRILTLIIGFFFFSEGEGGGQGHLSGVMEGEDNEGRQAYPMRRVDDLATRRGERIRSAISSFCPATHQHMSVCVHTEEKKEISTHLGYVASAEGHTMYRKTINKIKGETPVARRTARY